MPQISDIVIKAADETTDVTFTAVQGSAGPNVPALFRNNSVGSTVAEAPTLLVKASDNGSRSAKRVRVDFSWPLVSTDAGGNVKVDGRMSGEASVLVPQNQPLSVIKEQAHQFGNLIASGVVKACFTEGFAPRS